MDRVIKLTDGTIITPRFTQAQVVNPALDKFIPDKTNPGGTGNMDILVSIDESWKDLGPLPLFIYNHGGGRGGSSGDYFAPLQTANGAAVLSKLQLKNPGKYNAHIIATQNHSDNQANNEALIAYVKKLAAEGKVDLNRVYMSGFSMGSMYTVGFYTRHPEFLAAIVPLAGGNLPTTDQLTQNPEYTKTAIWAFSHKNDFMGNTWTDYFSTGAGASGLYKNANVTILDTNQAFNFPYYGFDWVPHETEAQAYSNLLGQSNALHRYGPSQEKYADKNIFDWMFAQFRSDNRTDDLKVIVAGLDLVPGNKNALTVKLNQASKLLGNTKENKSAEAIEVLNSFIHQVNAFIKPGKLSEAQANEMISAAEETIRYINYRNKLR